MDMLLPALPNLVALATVATIGYLFGRQQLRHPRPTTHSAVTSTRSSTGVANSTGVDITSSSDTGDDSDPASRETREVIRELQRVSTQVRLSLAAHHASVQRFNDSIQSLRRHADDATLQQLGDEAERILHPTRQLSVDIAHAYDEIRRHACRLQDKGHARASENRRVERPSQ